MFLPRKGPMLAVSAAVITMTGIAGAGDLPQEIIDCRALLTADERLSCYERVIDEDTATASDNASSSQSEPQPKASQTETASRAVPPPSAESASGEKRRETIAAAEDSQSPEALFGMSAEEQLVVVSKEEPSEQIEAGISELRYSRTGKAVITLDNGHIWQQIDSQKLHLSENDRVVIRRASLGSFLLKKAGSKKSMRVKRIS